MRSRLRCWSFGLKRTIGSGSVGATFQLGGKFGAGRSGGIPNAILISLTSEERRERPHIKAILALAGGGPKRPVNAVEPLCI
jgi:hypothetical protein